MNPHWTYALLHACAFTFPFLLSFDRRVAFYKQWKFLFPAIFLVAAFFVVWDIWFTSMNVWSFNPDYVLGYYFINLPWEEVLFFITIPYCCVFIYACLESYFPKLTFEKAQNSISISVMATALLNGLINYDKAYTLSACVLAAVLIGYVVFIRKAPWMGRFWLSYAVVLIPFFICNGVLTAKPVVLYNDLENMGIRMGTIPVEDLFYNLVMFLGVVLLFEIFKSRKDSGTVLNLN